MEADVEHAMRLARERGIVVNTDVMEKLRDRITRISDNLRSAITPRKPKP